MRSRILNVNMARRLQLPLLLFLLFSRSANITASTGHQYILWKSMGGDKNLSILLLLDPFPFFFSLILICGGYFRMQPNLNDSAISFTWAVVFQLSNWAKPIERFQ